MTKPKTSEPTPRGRPFIFRITDDWYVACRAGRLRREPLAITLLGTPLVMFRNRRGEAAALLDRCPHRNAPLSIGAVTGDNLQCAYHGWEFDLHTGKCLNFPESCVMTYELKIEDGEVWVKLR